MHGARASVARMHSKIEPSRSVDEKIKIAARDTDLSYDRQVGESFSPFFQILTRRSVTVSAERRLKLVISTSDLVQLEVPRVPQMPPTFSAMVDRKLSRAEASN